MAEKKRCSQGSAGPSQSNCSLYVGIIQRSYGIYWVGKVSVGLLWWLRWQRICLQCRRPGFDPWAGKILWRREWLLTPLFLPREFHGQKSLVGYSPWGHKESDPTERLILPYVKCMILYFCTQTFLSHTKTREVFTNIPFYNIICTQNFKPSGINLHGSRYGYSFIFPAVVDHLLNDFSSTMI